jgi:putative resolvase
MSGGPYVKPKLAIKQLGVDRRTLKLWAEYGYIKYIQPGGKGQRLYDVTSVANSETQRGENTSAPQLVDAIYCRVSTRKQLPDLERQKKALKESHPDHVIFSDCASGLNFKRKGFKALLQLAFERRLRVVRVANKDRLCRFAYDLVEHILEKHDAKIVVEAHDSHSVEQELAEDVLSIIAEFGPQLRNTKPTKRKRDDDNNAQACDESETERTKQ